MKRCEESKTGSKFELDIQLKYLVHTKVRVKYFTVTQIWIKEIMIDSFFKVIKVVSVGIGLGLTSNIMAQEKVEASVGADLVSNYIWRGQDLGGVSIQPSINVGYKGFSFEAWGSVGFSKKDAKELDLTLGYSLGGLSLSVTDYWYTNPEASSNKYFKYGAHSTNHVFEAQVGYDFEVVAINWATNFAGADGVRSNGDRAYSSYLSVVAPFKLGGLDWSAEIGAVPWETDYYNEYTSRFAISDISLSAKKEIKITDTFSIPVFAQATVNPRTEGAYFTFGMSF